MIRILVATADAARFSAPGGLAEHLRNAFAERLQLEVVGSALYALTSLERQRADLIVCGETLEDMTGRELFDLVCDDASLRQGPFILLSDGGGDLVLPDQQLVLAAQAAPAEVLTAAFTLLLASGKLGETEPLERGYERSAVKISGTLEALSLFDLVVSLGQGQRSGRLVVVNGDHEGILYLTGGRLNHATFAEAAGEDAVQEIFARVHDQPQTRFLFVSGVPPKTPKTVHTSLDKLLLQIAVNLDEQAEVDAPRVPA